MIDMKWFVDDTSAMKTRIRLGIAIVGLCVLVGLMAFFASAHAQTSTATPLPSPTPFPPFVPGRTPRP
jgi:hypothetical protein